MLRAMIENCCRPRGVYGRLMLRGMNAGHGPMARWALGRAGPGPGRILDIGCGGGANIRRLLRRHPGCRVDGVDYSAESVELSRRLNAGAVADGRCEIVEGDVMSLPFADGTYDAATAFETVYFWPDLTAALREVRRVLRSGGKLLIACEMNDPVKALKWSRHCAAMTVYTSAELVACARAAGFRETKADERGVWTALSAVK